jgi:hypothetical protein
MFTPLLLVFSSLQVSPAVVRAEPVWSLTLPENAAPVQGAQGLSSSGKQIVLLEQPARIVWWDAERKTRVAWPGVTAPQLDCGVGYFSVLTGEATKTFDVSTGKELSSVQGRATRVGALLHRVDPKRIDTYLSAEDGKVLWRHDPAQGARSGNGPYLGVPAWDSPRKRLFVAGIDGDYEKKELIECRPGTTTIVRRSHLSNFATVFSSIMGNPEAGPFVVRENHNRGSFPTRAFHSDLRPLAVDLVELGIREHEVADISPQGILLVKGERDGLFNFRASGIECRDIETGKVLWSDSSYKVAQWLGDQVLADERHLLDGRTGQRLARLELPEEFKPLRWEGDTVIGVRDRKHLQALRIPPIQPPPAAR